MDGDGLTGPEASYLQRLFDKQDKLEAAAFKPADALLLVRGSVSGSRRFS